MIGGRSILVALVAAALAWAYVATHRPGPSGGAPDAQVSVWSVPPDAIRAVVYRDGDRSVTITPDWNADKDEPYLWVDTQAKQGESAAPPPTADRQGRQKLERFKGNAVARTTLTLLANLRGKRALGRAETLDLALYDLADSRRYVELVFADGREPWRLDFGRAALGNALRYVRARTNDTVYLVRENLVNGLSGDGRRLFDNQLFPFNPSAAERIEIEAGGRTHTLYQLSTPDRPRLFWAARPDAEEGDGKLTEIAMRLARVQVETYAPREQELPLAPQLEVRMFKAKDGKSESAWLKVFPGGDEMQLAVSAHTRFPVYVKQQVVTDLIAALRKLPQSE